MKQTKRLLALLVVFLLALTACGGGPAGVDTPSAPPSDGPADSAPPSESPAPSDTPADAPERGAGPGVTVGLTALPGTLDPTLVSTAEEVTVAFHTGEGLLRWADSGAAASSTVNWAQLVPGQADSYDKETHEDGTVTYTFHLARYTQWSDGLPLTAQDFVYAWRRLVTPANGAYYAYLLEDVVNAPAVMAGEKDPKELAVEAPDDKTFVVTLARDAGAFLEACAFPATFPVRQDAVEKGNGRWSTSPTTWVGNGPYVLRGAVSYESVTLAPNQYYYGPDQVPGSLTFRYAIDKATLENYVQGGQIDFAVDLAIDFDAEEKAEKEEGDGAAVGLVDTKADRVALGGVYYLSFQTGLAPLDDPRVREAITLAVDRQKLVDQVLGSGQPAGGLVPRGVYGAGGPGGADFRTEGGDYYSLDSYETNLKRARELLAEAGYPAGEGFPTLEYVYNNNGTHEAVAAALQKMLKDGLGVELSLKGVNWTEYLSALSSSSILMLKNIWVGDMADPMAYLELWEQGAGVPWYGSEDYDGLLDRAEGAGDAARRMELLHQAEDLLVGKDWAVCPICFHTRDYRMAEGLTGLYYSPAGYFYFDQALRR